jgi:hypothetical protein
MFFFDQVDDGKMRHNTGGDAPDRHIGCAADDKARSSFERVESIFGCGAET